MLRMIIHDLTRAFRASAVSSATLLGTLNRRGILSLIIRRDVAFCQKCTAPNYRQGFTGSHSSGVSEIQYVFTMTVARKKEEYCRLSERIEDHARGTLTRAGFHLDHELALGNPGRSDHAVF